MACPYFIPTERLELGWQHPERLPLGAGWSGVCGAPGQMLLRPSEDELRECCNLGHAICSHLPADRTADSVRFIAQQSGTRIAVRYVFERACRPAGGGVLEYETVGDQWLTASPDEKLQRQAECFLAVWRSYRRQSNAAGGST